MINESETRECFKKSITKKYFDYLESRGITCKQYLEALRQKKFGFINENMLNIDGRPYSVQCILGRSDESIYDIIKTNELYGIEPVNGTAIAVMYGDDYVYLMPDDEKIYFMDCCFGKSMIIADTYDEFISNIRIVNE